MSEIRDTLEAVVSDRLAFTGDTITNLTTGKSFVGEVEDIADVELNTALGRDPRESLLIRVLDREAAEAIALNTRLTIGNHTVTVVRRKDNPESLQVEFGCVKRISRDQ